MNTNITIRQIELQDNIDIAFVIRTALTEFGANKPGTVYFDPTTDHLYELFRMEGSVYFVALKEGRIIGGAGIFPTENLPDGTCELVKLYLHQNARGTGLGKQLLLTAMDWAKQNGYNQVYLESMPELSKAVAIYENVGFKRLKEPLGNSGHSGCDIWMSKTI
jgi:putative acetyltransferase